MAPDDAPSTPAAQRRAALAERLLLDLGEATEVGDAAAIVAQSVTAIGGAAWARVVQRDPAHGAQGPGLVLASSGTVDRDGGATVRDDASGLELSHAEAEVPPIAIERALRALVAVTERIEQQRQLLDDARTDPLTGLLNRRAFDHRLESELARLARGGGAVSLLLLDVDDFKAVNDSLGHAHGDGVLRAIAEAMRSAGRTADDLARVGGDEFALVLPDTDAPGAVIAADRLRARVREGGAGATVSIGVATAHGDHRTDAATLVDAADQALYAAKRSGRDRTEVGRGGLAVGA